MGPEADSPFYGKEASHIIQDEDSGTSAEVATDVEAGTSSEVTTDAEVGTSLEVTIDQQAPQPPEVTTPQVSLPSDADFTHPAPPGMSRQARRQRLKRSKGTPAMSKKQRMKQGRVKSAVRSSHTSDFKLGPRSFVRTRKVEHEDKVYDISELEAMGMKTIQWDGK